MDLHGSIFVVWARRWIHDSCYAGRAHEERGFDEDDGVRKVLGSAACQKGLH